MIDHSVLPAVHDPHFSRDEPVAVGCAPVLETYDDVEIEFAERDGTTVYRLRPMDSSGLRSRIKAIVRRLDESGAQLAVMPEASLSDALLEHWKEVAFDTAGRDRNRRPLRFILLGTGPLGGGDPPPNRAVLLDRWTGRELLVQDKLSGFTLDAAQLRLWRLPDAATGTAAEYIRPGGKISVLDSSLGYRRADLRGPRPVDPLGARAARVRGVAPARPHLLQADPGVPVGGAGRRAAGRGDGRVGHGVQQPRGRRRDPGRRPARPPLHVPGRGAAEPAPHRLRFDRQFGVARTGAELGRLPTSELPRVSPAPPTTPGTTTGGTLSRRLDDERVRARHRTRGVCTTSGAEVAPSGTIARTSVSVTSPMGDRPRRTGHWSPTPGRSR